MSDIEDHIYFYPKVVYGSNLAASLYAFYNDLPIIKSPISNLQPTDFFGVNLDLTTLNFPYWENKFKQPDGEIKKFGWQKKFINDRINFTLSLAGKSIFSNKLMTATVKEEQSLIQVIVEGEKNIKIKFGELVVFDDLNILGLSQKSGAKKKQIIDFIDVVSGHPHDIDYIKTKYDIPSEIYFHKSTRKFRTSKTKDVKRKIEKDIISVSYVKTSELKKEEFELSEMGILLSLGKVLKECGFKGRKKGFNFTLAGIPIQRYDNLLLKFGNRVIRDIDKNVYEETDKIKFKLDATEEQVLLENIGKRSYCLDLLQKIFINAPFYRNVPSNKIFLAERSWIRRQFQ